MKKHISQLVGYIILFTLAIFAGVADAQNAPVVYSGSLIASPQPTIPVSVIQSQDLMRQVALPRVVYGNRHMDSQGVAYEPSNVTSISVTGNGAEDVLNKLLGQNFKFKPLNSVERVQSWIYLYDANWQLLFSGYAEDLVDSEMELELNYEMWQQSLPILSDARSAEVLALAEDGTTANRTSLEVNEHGQILFPTHMAGAVNGILAVRFKDGALVTYRFSSPTPKSPTEITSGDSTWKIQGHHVYEFQCPDGFTCTGLVKIIETWELPTVFMRVGNSQDINFDVMGLVQGKAAEPFFERPTAIIINDTRVPLLGGAPITMKFEAGEYRIRFEWVSFGQSHNLYAGPMDGGGKG